MYKNWTSQFWLCNKRGIYINEKKKNHRSKESIIRITQCTAMHTAIALALIRLGNISDSSRLGTGPAPRANVKTNLHYEKRTKTFRITLSTWDMISFRLTIFERKNDSSNLAQSCNLLMLNVYQVSRDAIIFVAHKHALLNNIFL